MWLPLSLAEPGVVPEHLRYHKGKKSSQSEEPMERFQGEASVNKIQRKTAENATEQKSTADNT